MHVHQSKVMNKTSRIESHVRNCVQDEFKKTNVVSGENAFDCNIAAQLVSHHCFRVLNCLKWDKFDIIGTINLI